MLEFYHKAIYTVFPINWLKAEIIEILINNIKTAALVDTGSTNSFINLNFTRIHNIKIFLGGSTISMANSLIHSPVSGISYVDLDIKSQSHQNVKMSVLQNFCVHIIIGQDILKYHSSVEISSGGPWEPISICQLLCHLLLCLQ